MLVDETEIKVAELSGEEVDSKRRLEILKKEEESIVAEKEAVKQKELEERQRAEAEAAEILVNLVYSRSDDSLFVLDGMGCREGNLAASFQARLLILSDTAEVIQEDEGISKADWLTLKGGITNERDVLTKIKEDREEFREELKELEIEDEDNALSESLGSSRLGKKVDSMISQIEERLKQLEEELIERPEALGIDTDGDGRITTEELIVAIRKLQHAPSEEKCRKLADMLDQDKDGNLDLDDVETSLVTDNPTSWKMVRGLTNSVRHIEQVSW
ncbi:hypothetical protein QZH41_000833 [Actinostola sp. cb2023]|nr:hypothetical protein QZH41_000833 [Actinostola sp. cb2023]